MITRFNGLASRRPKSWPYNVFALLALAVARDFVTPNYPHGTTSPGGSNHPPGRAENGCSDAFVALVVLVGVVANFSFGGWSVFCMLLERLRSGSWRWSSFFLGIGVGFLFAPKSLGLVSTNGSARGFLLAPLYCLRLSRSCLMCASVAGAPGFLFSLPLSLSRLALSLSLLLHLARAMVPADNQRGK